MAWPLEYTHTHTLQETGLRTRPHRQLVYTSENNRDQKDKSNKQKAVVRARGTERGGSTAEQLHRSCHRRHKRPDS